MPESSPESTDDETPTSSSTEKMESSGPAEGGFWRDTLQPQLKNAAAGTAATFGYYWAHRGELWGFCIEAMPFLEATGDRQREIRITPDDALGRDAYDGKSWQVTLPDCCVVTGEPGTGEWIEEEYRMPNVEWPFWALLVGIVGGCVLSMAMHRFAMWPLSIFVGMAVGYRNRAETVVSLRFRRREPRDGVPVVRVFPKVLLLRLGSAAAKRALVQCRVDQDQPGSPLATDSPLTTGGSPARSEDSSQKDSTVEQADQDSSSGPEFATPGVRKELPSISLEDDDLDDSAAEEGKESE